MSYEKSSAYREYALIEAINLLVNMVDRIKDDRIVLKEIPVSWINSGMLSFGDQMELIWGTAADGMRCRNLAFRINLLNGYLITRKRNKLHRGLVSMYTKDILDAINMAVMGSAHIWTQTQLRSIEAAFKSSRVSKARPFYEPKELEDKEDKKSKRKVLEYIPD